VSKPRVGPINCKHFTFKRGNIFASICTLVLSLWARGIGFFQKGPISKFEKKYSAEMHQIKSGPNVAKLFVAVIYEFS
jgi:hypothetical protein